MGQRPGCNRLFSVIQAGRVYASTIVAEAWAGQPCLMRLYLLWLYFQWLYLHMAILTSSMAILPPRALGAVVGRGRRRPGKSQG